MLFECLGVASLHDPSRTILRINQQNHQQNGNFLFFLLGPLPLMKLYLHDLNPFQSILQTLPILPSPLIITRKVVQANPLQDGITMRISDIGERLLQDFFVLGMHMKSIDRCWYAR